MECRLADELQRKKHKTVLVHATKANVGAKIERHSFLNMDVSGLPYTPPALISVKEPQVLLEYEVRWGPVAGLDTV
jgi:hypothetical protein